MGWKERGIKRLDGGLAGAQRLGFPDMNPEGTQGTRDFRTTHWSLVADAADSRAPGAEAALAEICRAYWAPLYVFARTQGVEAEEARDLTQGFFEYFLEQKVYAGADRSWGPGWRCGFPGLVVAPIPCSSRRPSARVGRS